MTQCLLNGRIAHIVIHQKSLDRFLPQKITELPYQPMFSQRDIVNDIERSQQYFSIKCCAYLEKNHISTAFSCLSAIWLRS